MPYPMPRPKPLVNEGWRYGFIKATPIVKEIKCKKGTPEEYFAELLLLTIVTAIPDEDGKVECDCEGTIFLHSDVTKGSNYQYMKFLDAIGVGTEEVNTPNGKMSVLPDPDPDIWVGAPLKVLVYHETRDTAEGVFTRAKISKYEHWDGTNPETGEKIEEPELDRNGIPF